MELDPELDLAHHCLGVWHREMASLGTVVKFVVRLVYGTNLEGGSYSDAYHHFRRAADLHPR